MRLFASNTGPCISLEKLDGGFDLLRVIGCRIVIPPQVLEELTEGRRPGSDYISDFSIADIVQVDTPPKPDAALDALDYGERYAISLASARKLPLLIEDRQGRDIARRIGIEVSGIAGLILFAQWQGALPMDRASQHLEALHTGGRINKKLLENLMGALRHRSN
jgi:predicted nucleic acid-binding protein